MNGRGTQCSATALAAGLALLGFAAAAAASATEAGPVIAVTVPPQGYIAERLAGGIATVVVMIPSGNSEETFEPTPGEAARLLSARIYFMVGHPGMAFETRYIAPFVASHPNVAVVSLADGAELDPVSAGDPHLWMSPALMARAASRLARAIEALEPAAAPRVEENLRSLLADIASVEASLRAAAGDGGRAFLIYHPNLGYVARDFGLRQIPIEVDGKEPGLASLVALAESARGQGARLIFTQPGQDASNSRVLADSIGARVVEIDGLSPDWLGTLRTIAKALADTPPGRAK